MQLGCRGGPRLPISEQYQDLSKKPIAPLSSHQQRIFVTEPDQASQSLIRHA
jgi:hypothetical protein